MERYLVGCYDAAEGGHFSPHRDNTTPGTAHRRFAISINLNDDFEGGEVSFPEYGPRGFAFLPFVYDNAAAAIREANRGSLSP